MKIKEVVPQHSTNRLNQIYQHNTTQFAFARFDSVKDILIQCHPFVHCRDFLLDVLIGNEENIDMNIAGLSYTKESPRIDVASVSIMLKLANNGALKNFQDNFKILKDIEEFVGFGPSYPDIVKHPDPHSIVVWVASDPRWQQSTAIFSLYSFILKCLTYEIKDKERWIEEIKEARTVESDYADRDYIQFLLNHMEEILAGYRTVSGFPDQKNQPISKLHNNSGFIKLKCALEGSDSDDWRGWSLRDHALWDKKATLAEAA